MTTQESRAVRSSTLHHVFLISWMQFIIVIMCSVTKTTQSNDGNKARAVLNTSSYGEYHGVKTVETFVIILSAPCPPSNNLHLVCDGRFGVTDLTCDERVYILKTCYKKYPSIYTNSNWKICRNNNQCETVFKNVLDNDGFISGIDGENEERTKVTTVTTKRSPTTNDKVNVTLTSVPVSNISITPLTTLVPYRTSIRMNGDGGSDAGEMPPVSYVYPFIGGFIIALEMVLLCLFSCYKKKRERQNVAVSLVQQEEMIEAETVSPTKAALPMNSIFDEDSVFIEDKTIYKSYLNLKYIDDTSVESTPEKALLRT